MTKKVGTRIPENTVETQDNLVEISVAQSLDGFDFPVGKRWVESDRVGKALRILCDSLFQNTKWKCAKYCVGFVSDGVGVVPGI